MTDKPILSSDQLINRAIEIANEGRKAKVVVPAAQDEAVIDAVAQSYKDGFIDAVLVGDEKKINEIADEENIDLSGLEMIHEPDVNQAAHLAVKMASEGEANAIMKGFLPTSTLLKTVLDQQYGLRGKNTLSHCAVLDIPGYHKMLNMTDGGMIVKPDQEQKYQILENAVLVGYALGLSPVKIAVSSPIEKPTEKISHSLSDIDFLIPKALENLDNIAIQGSIPFDIATSEKAAKLSNCSGPVVGDTDIFLVNSIEECNIIAKSLINFANAVFSGVIVGAKVPVSLVSRTDTVKNKKSSLALASVLADYYKQTEFMKEGVK